MTAVSVELEIRRILSEIMCCPHPLQASANVPLDDVGLDSIGMIHLLYRLEEDFGFQIHDDDVTPENFESIASLVVMVNRKCGD